MALPGKIAEGLAELRSRAIVRALAPLVRDADVLVLECSGAAELRSLAELGARSVAATIAESDRATAVREQASRAEVVAAEAVELPFEADRFDLVLWLASGQSERAAAAAVCGEARRILRAEGALVAAEETTELLGDALATRRPLAVDQALAVAVREPGADAMLQVDPKESGRTIVVASSSEIPALPAATASSAELLAAALEALGDWEERARDAEAEVAAMRWENRIAGEKLTALVNRLHELENAPGRRLARLLRGRPPAVSHQTLADPPRGERPERR